MSRSLHSRLLTVLLALGMAFTTEARAGTTCVWKVTATNGKFIYLGGSVHSLAKGDYPLSAPYERAFDASSRVAFEVDARALQKSSESLVKEGKYRKGDRLSNHVDPRTYDYLRRLFALMNISEE